MEEIEMTSIDELIMYLNDMPEGTIVTLDIVGDEQENETERG